MNTLTYRAAGLLHRRCAGPGHLHARRSCCRWRWAFVGLALLQGVLHVLGAGGSRRKTSEGIVQRLRDYLFDHIQRLSFRYHDKAQTGELIQRSTSDVDAIRRFFADQAVNAGRIVHAVCDQLHRDAAPERAAGASFRSSSSRSCWSSRCGFSSASARRTKRTRSKRPVVSTTLQENLTGVRVVKAFARQDVRARQI